ncbi:hypothetical protein SDJN02_24670, partial [Cucurbita argyrosperma subsp. argyrosperma]
MRDERKNVAPGDAAIGKDELKQVGSEEDKSDWAVAIGLINQVFAEEGRVIAAEGGDSLVQSLARCRPPSVTSVSSFSPYLPLCPNLTGTTAQSSSSRRRLPTEFSARR